MFFLILLTLGSLILAGSAIFFSVLGLVQTFSITAMVWGSAIECAKLLTASFLTRYWESSGFATKVMGVTSIVALMLITSAGIYGHILSSYQKQSLSLDSNIILLETAEETLRIIDERIESLIDRRSRIEDSIESITSDISSISTREDNYITARTRQTDSMRSDRELLREELNDINVSLVELNDRRDEALRTTLDLKNTVLLSENEVGPIVIVMRLLGDDAGGKTIMWFILLIVLVFDPVAVYLIVQANKVAMIRARDKDTEMDSAHTPEIHTININDANTDTESIHRMESILGDVLKNSEVTTEAVDNLKQVMDRNNKIQEIRRQMFNN